MKEIIGVTLAIIIAIAGLYKIYKDKWNGTVLNNNDL
jgi:hypothetical protein